MSLSAYAPAANFIRRVERTRTTTGRAGVDVPRPGDGVRVNGASAKEGVEAPKDCSNPSLDEGLGRHSASKGAQPQCVRSGPLHVVVPSAHRQSHPADVCAEPGPAPLTEGVRGVASMSPVRTRRRSGRT